MQDATQHYINGQWVASIDGREMAVEDPSTEEKIATITLGGDADADAAVAAAKAAFPGWAATELEARVATLERLMDVYKERAGEMAEAISAEMGAPIALAKTAQVSDVLGGLLLSLLGQAAFTRINLPTYERRPFIIYADEFHNFTTESTAGMLSELRKFKIGLVLAGQYTSQIERPVLDAIFGNVGTMIVFRCGVQDAPLLAAQLEIVRPANLIGQPNYQLYIRLMIKGSQSSAFTAITLDS